MTQATPTELTPGTEYMLRVYIYKYLYINMYI